MHKVNLLLSLSEFYDILSYVMVIDCDMSMIHKSAIEFFEPYLLTLYGHHYKRFGRSIASKNFLHFS